MTCYIALQLPTILCFSGFCCVCFMLQCAICVSIKTSGISRITWVGDWWNVCITKIYCLHWGNYRFNSFFTMNGEVRCNHIAASLFKPPKNQFLKKISIFRKKTTTFPLKTTAWLNWFSETEILNIPFILSGLCWTAHHSVYCMIRGKTSEWLGGFIRSMLPSSPGCSGEVGPT